jgi:hypothetical protein
MDRKDEEFVVASLSSSSNTFFWMRMFVVGVQEWLDLGSIHKPMNLEAKEADKMTERTLHGTALTTS